MAGDEALAAAVRAGTDAQWFVAGHARQPETRLRERTAIMTEALKAAEPHIRAAIYAELGNEHHVIFTEDGWTVEHSVECRLSGHMHECGYFTAASLVADEYRPVMAGRWKITGVDSQGRAALEREEATHA